MFRIQNVSKPANTEWVVQVDWLNFNINHISYCYAYFWQTSCKRECSQIDIVSRFCRVGSELIPATEADCSEVTSDLGSGRGGDGLVCISSDYTGVEWIILYWPSEMQALWWNELGIFLCWKALAYWYSNVLVSCKTKPPPLFRMRDFKG